MRSPLIFKDLVREKGEFCNAKRNYNSVHTGWQQTSLTYINEHIYVYKRTHFIISGT